MIFMLTGRESWKQSPWYHLVKKISFRESWRQNDRWTSSMKLRWNSQIHLISLKISHKQDIRHSKQIYLGLKIQIKEILILFKEMTFFETKENRDIWMIIQLSVEISQNLSIMLNIWWKDENSFEIQQEIDKLLQFQFKNKWLNETRKNIFKSHHFELISFGIIYLFIVLFCLEFLCIFCHFSLLRNWLFFLFSMILNNTNETWKKSEECRNFEKIVEKNILHSSTLFYKLLFSSYFFYTNRQIRPK